MKTLKYILSAFFLVLGIHSSISASHVAGVELTYRCLNFQVNQYEVTLTMYRDCLNGNVGFDPVVFLFVFAGNTGERLGFYPLKPAFENPDTISVNDANCTASPLNLCLEMGQYIDTIFLPPLPDGYDLSWARCCRNEAISNIPSDQGISVLTHIPGTLPNNSPQFQNLPSLFICNNEPFNLDYSATDVDGDSLTYEIVTPWTGQNSAGWGAHANFASVIPQNPMGPPPYNNLNFLAGFSAQTPFGQGNFSINSQTGLISLTPIQEGLFVFTTSVREYRNGVLLSENRRDFQVKVVECLPQGTLPVISHDLSGWSNSGNDTLFVQSADSFCYSISLFDSASADFVEFFPASSSLGIGGAMKPPFAQLSSSGKNPIQGEICWRPSCELAGDTIPIIVGGRDLKDCFGTNQVFDTVWVVVLPLKQVEAGNDTSICVNGGIAQLQAENAYRYKWTPSIGLSRDSIFNPLASPPTSQLYQVTGWDSLGCPTRDSLWVWLIPPIPVSINGSDSLCLGQKGELDVSGGLNYLWSTGDITPNISLIPNQTTYLWALGYDSLGCPGDSVWYELYVEANLPLAGFTAFPTEGYGPLEVQFQNRSFYSSRFVWDFGDGSTSQLSNPSYTFLEPGRHQVKLTADNTIGCADSIAVTYIEVWSPKWYIPNAFTPNGDGHNDVFFMSGGGIKAIDLSIYNRWGQKIFYSRDPSFNWNGSTPSGQIAPEGVYAWHIVVFPWTGDSWQRSGTVTLIR
ncbi:MAG: gliding motility-associated C-terminal domain-containing protein [Bacteroidia bacterium]|nr:gliding motility-associated C-terminal domain-containing protein [Bacteroidia bacterium]